MDNMEPVIETLYCEKHVTRRGQLKCLPWYQRWWGWIDETLWIWRLVLRKRLGL